MILVEPLAERVLKDGASNARFFGLDKERQAHACKPQDQAQLDQEFRELLSYVGITAV